jgi:hypothetical protein
MCRPTAGAQWGSGLGARMPDHLWVAMAGELHSPQAIALESRQPHSHRELGGRVVLAIGAKAPTIVEQGAAGANVLQQVGAQPSM